MSLFTYLEFLPYTYIFNFNQVCFRKPLVDSKSRKKVLQNKERNKERERERERKKERERERSVRQGHPVVVRN